MAENVFAVAWWPVHVAIAWVLTRDRAFVERSNRVGGALRHIAIALAMDKADGKPTERYFKDSSDAWSALREEIAAGNARAFGTPFRRVADLQDHAVETNEMAREIPAAEIASLRLQDDNDDKDCLIPEDWRVAHGSNRRNLRGYRNVGIFRDDVLRAFDACLSNVSDSTEQIEGCYPVEQPQQPRVSTRPARERGSRAIQALYPDGVPDQATIPNAKLCRSVSDWLKEQKLTNVSDATILRAADRRK